MKETPKKASRHRQTKKELAHQLQEALDKIAYMEHYDELTQLPNLSIFLELCTTRLNQAAPPPLSALLIFDLDNFGDINYLFGRHTGDLILQQVAARMTTYLGADDILARKGSDKFIVFLNHAVSMDALEAYSDTLLQALALPYHVETHTIHVTASLGISVSPLHAMHAEALFNYANMALQQAKELGKNNGQFFIERMINRTQNLTRIETQLHHALLNQEFFLCYQPQMNIQNHTILGMEALLRWSNPEIGHISPIDFIPLAEKSGLIIPISDWVLQNASQQMAYWSDTEPPIQIAINLSAREFQTMGRSKVPSLIQRIESMLEQTKLAPTQLELEITESSIMKNYAVAIPTMHALRNMGVRIACDDFGTGYSSLTCLKRLPIDTLKIDKSFVDDVTWNPNDVAIIRAILSIAEQLGIRVIAEGVEDISQVRILEDLGCTNIQGFYFGKPMPAEEATQLLQNKRALPL